MGFLAGLVAQGRPKLFARLEIDVAKRSNPAMDDGFGAVIEEAVLAACTLVPR